MPFPPRSPPSSATHVTCHVTTAVIRYPLSTTTMGLVHVHFEVVLRDFDNGEQEVAVGAAPHSE